MKGIIAVKNNKYKYCGFDRSYSYWNDLISNDNSKFLIVDDLFAVVSCINEVEKYYLHNIKQETNLIFFSENEISIKDFNLIGLDCGYLYDTESDFYVGFSTIANEILRLNNELCDFYKKTLNKYMLFPSLEQVYEYKRKRDIFLKNRKINLERSFDFFSILYIYIYQNNRLY